MKCKLNVYKLRKPSLFLNSHLNNFGYFKNMGANSSSSNELSSNDYLKKLSSSEPINPIDPYWNQLLSFSFLIPINR